MMVKNCPTYNQIILPIALMSICALFKFKSSNALLDTVMCHRLKLTALLRASPDRGTLSIKGL
jgi:hypothetical protein